MASPLRQKNREKLMLTLPPLLPHTPLEINRDSHAATKSVFTQP